MDATAGGHDDIITTSGLREPAMRCKNPTCQRTLGPIEGALSDAVGGHCTSCALERGLFKDQPEETAGFVDIVLVK